MWPTSRESGPDLDAAVALLATATLAGTAAWFLRAGEPEWAAFALLVVGVAAAPAAATRDPWTTLPGELLWLTAVPVLVRAAGYFPQATPFLAVGGLALLVALVLSAYTSLAMTPRFAAVFVVVTTMAFAGAWAIGEWAADAALGTTFLRGTDELMWDLATATGMGALAGLLADVYFARADRLSRLGAAPAPATARTPETGVDVPGEAAHHRTAVRALQVALAGVVTLSLLRREGTLLINSAVPLAVTFLPGVLRREYGYPMDAALTLWVTLAATLHAVGALGLYATLGWYDALTHALSASLVAGVGYAVARAVELHTDEVAFNAGFRRVFVVLFVLAVGVAWELLEFASGGLASLVGGEPVLAQYGTGDIARDLLFDAVGAALVAAMSAGRFEGIARRLSGRVGAAVFRDSR